MNPSTAIQKLLLAGAAAAVFAISATSSLASTTHIIYSFAGDTDGEYADTDLVVDSAGNIYGSTVLGGDFGSGTVFKVTPGGQHSGLYSFTGGADGGEPYKGVTLDAQGNLYGTAVTGGGGGCEGGCGVVYKVTNSNGSWSQSVIYSFSGGNDGSGPGAGLTFDRFGNLYGMTPTGGAYGVGVIFQLQPMHGGGWKFNVIHPFTGGNDGSGGSAGRLVIHNGRLYGVTTAGGANGKGIVFELSQVNPVAWNFRTLYAFRGQPDAGFPYGGVTFDAAGSLYGTTYYDGAYNLGSVYELTPEGAGTWTEKVLYSFQGGNDGSGSIANVLFDATGNMYGTTSQGGASCSCGVIFKLSPDGHGNWSESISYRFQGPPDGAFAYNGMVVGLGGAFYGSTVHGGPTDDGTIYKFQP
jgi:uncharacterized repeat protein (TIGR03803 family)